MGVSVRGLFPLLLALFFQSAATAQTADTIRTLQRQYVGKVVMVRGFYAGHKLSFDATGNIIGDAKQGYWSSDGLLEVTKLSAGEDGRILVAGNRLITVYGTKGSHFDNDRTKLKLQIEIATQPEHASTAELQSVLRKVFSFEKADLTEGIPEYWKCWVVEAGHNENDQRKKCRDEIAKAAFPERYLGDGKNWASKNDKTLKPPSVRSAPDPDYTEIARESKLQGTSVLWVLLGEDGVPRNVQIERPLGGGLDDKAVECIRNWKFSPAMKDGKPLAVQINVEVNFRVY